MSARTMLFLKRIIPPFTCSLPSNYSFASTSHLSAVKSQNEPQTEAEEDCRRQRISSMTEFLLNECGLLDSQILALCRKKELLCKVESISRAQQVVQLFRDYGFTEDQVRKISFLEPNSLKVKVDTQLKHKLELLKALGFAGSNLGHIISRAPRLFCCSLEHNLSCKISLLLSVFGSKLDLCKTLMWNPRLLLCKIDYLDSKIDILKQSGMQDEVLSFLIRRRLSLIFGSEEVLKLKIEYVRNLGFLEGTKAFAYALAAVHGSALENFENKLKHMATLGLLENEIMEIVRKLPNTFTNATDKITKNMDFLKNTAGFQPNIVVLYPRLLNYSVEDRLQPRHKVIEFLRETESSRLLPRSLATVYTWSEQRFADRILMDSPEATEVFEKYKS